MKLGGMACLSGIEAPLVGRITTTPLGGAPDDEIYLSRDGTVPTDLRGLAVLAPRADRAPGTSVPAAWAVPQLDYLMDGDVVAIEPTGFVRTLYRRSSPHNSLLMTEQCNSYCLMCSQPPRKHDDFDRLAEHLRVIDLIAPDTSELGFTGGEPTLFRDGFLQLVAHCKEKLPRTALHVLTNGRLFYYRRFAERLGKIDHPELMLGIPLYSDCDSEHDYVVQSKGAFEETVLGLHHLDRYDIGVEIRVVLHRQTIPRLSRLAKFIARNFPFAQHVALMGLEMFGFVHKNFDELWIDPFEYRDALREATQILALAGMNVSIYNHQLCVLSRDVWRFARKSISDWKNIYLDDCEDCAVRDQCGGFFESARRRHSAYIRRLQLASEAACEM